MCSLLCNWTKSCLLPWKIDIRICTSCSMGIKNMRFGDAIQTLRNNYGGSASAHESDKCCSHFTRQFCEVVCRHPKISSVWRSCKLPDMSSSHSLCQRNLSVSLRCSSFLKNEKEVKTSSFKMLSTLGLIWCVWLCRESQNVMFTIDVIVVTPTISLIALLIMTSIVPWWPVNTRTVVRTFPLLAKISTHSSEL